jgi:SAM-dependent methyltransferase
MEKEQVVAEAIRYKDNPNSIKYYVKRYVDRNISDIKDRIIVDFPAGNGVVSQLIGNAGGKVEPFDLFPEYFQIPGLSCKKADINEGIPLQDKYADMIICQEGIEHFPDQMKAFKEFNRILKHGELLLITTPNYSNLRARMSYLLSESERFNSIMPPNEIDSVWMSTDKTDSDIYYGHIFLTGIQKLRILAKLSGFNIKRIHKTKLKTTSLFLFPFLYPFIFLSNGITYLKAVRKKHSDTNAKEVYREVFKLSLSPVILLYSHLMIEFEKELDVIDVKKTLVSRFSEFGIT